MVQHTLKHLVPQSAELLCRWPGGGAAPSEDRQYIKMTQISQQNVSGAGHSTKGVCACLVQDSEKGKEVETSEPTHDYDRYYAEYDDDEEVGMLAWPLGL